ncbi:hypothetical protein SDC9_165549 [bioreactor metagenome]|uniref:Uncharacterized protein n=1 Tax=bioreactor metagenome TaxID=1076179 RepID=A0A645FUL6_9ZZZZ
MLNIADIRYVFNTAGAVNQYGGGYNGDRCVLCAADFHFTLELVAASDDILVQENTTHVLSFK